MADPGQKQTRNVESARRLLAGLASDFRASRGGSAPLGLLADISSSLSPHLLRQALEVTIQYRPAGLRDHAVRTLADQLKVADRDALVHGAVRTGVLPPEPRRAPASLRSTLTERQRVQRALDKLEPKDRYRLIREYLKLLMERLEPGDPSLSVERLLSAGRPKAKKATRKKPMAKARRPAPKKASRLGRTKNGGGAPKRTARKSRAKPPPPPPGGEGQAPEERLVEANGGGYAEANGGARAEPPMTEAPPEEVAGNGDGGSAPPAARRYIAARVVSTEFASAERPTRSLASTIPLATGGRYFLRLRVGRKRSKHAIEESDAPPLPGDLEVGETLTVVLFPFEGELELDDHADLGVLRIEEDGTVGVSRQPLPTQELAKAGLAASVQTTWLYFPIRAPERPGVARVRCHIYCKQVLLQSRVVTAQVMRMPSPRRGDALTATVDYALMHRLAAEPIKRLEPHLLSLLVNDNGDASHTIRMFGHDGEEWIKQSLKIKGGTLEGLVVPARQALRKAAWGTTVTWDSKKDHPRYGDAVPTEATVLEDLLTFAFRGRDFFQLLAGVLADVEATDAYTQMDRLRSHMKLPGYVQVAMLESAGDLFPASMVYDYPLREGEARYELCPETLAGLRNGSPWSEVACFEGTCSQAGDQAQPNRVCAGGFWGFRHRVGLPLSLPSTQDVPDSICYPDRPLVTAGVCTDLKLLDVHEEALDGIYPRDAWTYGRTRQDVLQNLKQTSPQVVYFYCHGGSYLGSPFLVVGSDRDAGIKPGDLREDRVQWRTRPLVFLNGCETTDLQTDSAVEFLTFFVRDAKACGVIGTEITVFEPWAHVFAEEFLREFIVQGESAGESVRRARATLLLRRRNPLGLAYVPLVLASLQLRKATPASPCAN